MQQLFLWALLVCTLVTDKQGRHFRRSQLPDDAASAMVQACAERNPFDADADGRLCVATLLVMGALESGWTLHIAGDGGRAQGPYGEWEGGSERDATWLRASRHYLATISRAMRVCPDQPIAPLAGERCGSSRVHVSRWGQIRALVGVDLPEAKE